MSILQDRKMRLKMQSQRVSVTTWNALDGGKNKHGFKKKINQWCKK